MWCIHSVLLNFVLLVDIYVTECKPQAPSGIKKSTHFNPPNSHSGQSEVTLAPGVAGKSDVEILGLFSENEEDDHNMNNQPEIPGIPYRSGPECGSFEAVAHLALANRIVQNTIDLEEMGGTASLHNSNTTLNITTHKCGAVLISPWYLLTAAHCVNGSERLTAISLGREDLNVNFTSGPNTYEISETIIHHNYNKSMSAYNDIAILKTARKVEYSNTIWPFCLPENNLMLNNYYPVKIAGWGKVKKISENSKMQIASIDYLDKPSCESLWDKYGLNIFDNFKENYYPEGVNSQVLCAQKRGVSACQGDSGGPMSYINQDGFNTVIGLVSKGISNCPKLPVTPGFFTNIANYVDWIYNITELQPYTECSEMEGFFMLEGSTKCLKAILKLKPWVEADKHCKREGLVLAKPDNNERLQNYLVETYGNSDYWLGGPDTVNSSSTTSWHLGKVLNDPDNTLTTENCLLLMATQYSSTTHPETPYWSENCSYTYKFLCERILN